MSDSNPILINSCLKTFHIQSEKVSHFFMSSVPRFKSLLIPRRSVYYIPSRFMHRSRDIIAKTSYNLLSQIFDPSVLSAMSKTDKTLFIDVLFNYSFNPNDGALPHKASLLHQIFREKYSSNIFKDHYRNYSNLGSKWYNLNNAHEMLDYIQILVNEYSTISELGTITKKEILSENHLLLYESNFDQFQNLNLTKNKDVNPIYTFNFIMLIFANVIQIIKKWFHFCTLLPQLKGFINFDGELPVKPN